MESNPVKRALREKDMTYADAASKIGITVQAVAAIVNGETRGATARYALASLLGHTVEQLWPNDESELVA
jgi:DNA-binding XRE family transcriptional regulator